jgi:hypothetical protein
LTTTELAGRIDQLLTLCDRAIDGVPDEGSARDGLQQALSAEGCPLRQASSSGYAETIRQEAERRAEIVLALDVSSMAYKAAVTGLKRHLVALRDVNDLFSS